MKSIICFLALAWAPSGYACSYLLSTADASRASQRIDRGKNYIANEYCAASDIDVSPIPLLGSYGTNYPPKQYCGNFHNTWSDVNSSIVLAPIGVLDSWVIVSTRVMRDCLKLPDKVVGKNPITNAFGFTDNNGYVSPISDTQREAWKAYCSLCWQSCSYRSGGSIRSREPPATFEFLFTPFSGTVSAKEMMSNRVATSGFAEFSPDFMLLMALNFESINTLLLSTASLSILHVLTYARSSVLAAAFLEHSKRFLTHFVFPMQSWATDDTQQLEVDGKIHAKAFWKEVAGCVLEECPLLACGDAYVTNIESNVMPKYLSKTLIEGSLDGDDVGCANPFIAGFVYGVNTTESGEEHLASALSLQLISGDGSLYKVPPVVGSFEDISGAVCPHAWFESQSGGVDEWLEILSNFDYDASNWETPPNDEGVGGTKMGLAERCASDAVDLFSNRMALATADVYQYSQQIMYLPSDFEVYSQKQFDLYVFDYLCYSDSTTQNCPQSGGGQSSSVWEMSDEQSDVLTLMLMKLRFRNHEAEHHAAEDINNFGSRVMSAQECGFDENDFKVVSGISNPPPVDSSPCMYMYYLMLITSQCSEATKKASNSAQCEENFITVLAMLREVCSGDCSKDILSDYFCTTLSQLSGSTCNGMDVLYFYMNAASTSCDAWYLEFSPDYCSNAGFGYGYGVGSDGSSMYGTMNYDVSSFGVYGMDMGYGWYGYGYGSRKLSHDILLMSTFKDETALDNILPSSVQIAVAKYSTSGTPGSYLTLMDFPAAYKTSDTIEASKHLIEASKMIELANKWLVDESLPSGKTLEHPNRVSILSTGLTDLRSAGPEMDAVRDLMGEFIHHVTQAWHFTNSVNTDDDKVPIFPSCDPEFEESLVRDAIEIATSRPKPAYGDDCFGSNPNTDNCGVDAGEKGPCKMPPVLMSASALVDVLEKRYAKRAARFFW